jgi:hypothetical protein
MEEFGMGMRIFWAILLLAACVGGFYLVQHHLQEKQLADGAVTCTGCMTPEEKARFDKENSGDTADGQSDRKVRTAREEDAAGNPEGAAAAGQVAPAAAPAAAPVAGANTVTPNVVPAQQQAPASGFFNIGSSASSTPPPVADSQPPNAPNGMRYTGSGAYQWYRQGDLTWRVDTVSGGSCIAFATLEEWRKQIVYSHGCGRGA